MEILYYPSKTDNLWNAECETIMPFCFGKGIDVGCGGRSIKKNIVRCDIDVKKNPEILSSADKIPVNDSSFDYLVAMHILEHFENQEKALKEWVRIVKNKGYICVIHPDLNRTGPQKPAAQNPSLAADPYNKHYHERSVDNFITYMKKNQKMGYRLFSFGDVGNYWSCFAILKVTKATS